MPKLKITVEEFDNAFKLLNEKLNSNNLHIVVKAIGGYAMLKYGLRKDINNNDGFSEDVDSVTEQYTPKILELIKEVAKERDLLEDWLNNEPINLPEVADVIDELKWVLDKQYSNITLYIADIDSLLLLKVRAVEGGGLIPRKTDKNDLIKILKFMGIYDFNQLILESRTKFIEKYKLCFDYLKERNIWN